MLKIKKRVKAAVSSEEKCKITSKARTCEEALALKEKVDEISTRINAECIKKLDGEIQGMVGNTQKMLIARIEECLSGAFEKRFTEAARKYFSKCVELKCLPLATPFKEVMGYIKSGWSVVHTAVSSQPNSGIWVQRGKGLHKEETVPEAPVKKKKIVLTRKGK